jgi:tRNA (guanine37-N1)-methyltransferase
MSPKGKILTQADCDALTKESELFIVCGHYEGIDQRFIDKYVTREISIGDYVLTGGELPAMVLIDSVSRLLPGVLGKQDSYEDESHMGGLLEYPHYTRPPEFDGLDVPEVLLSGHHANIEKWRLEESIKVTEERRPDMIDALLKDPSTDKKILKAIHRIRSEK